MTSREFCYWLQGYFEVNANRPQPAAPESLNTAQVQVIQRHLSLVFAHEIDPSYPNAPELNNIHNAGKKNYAGEPVMRC